MRNLGGIAGSGFSHDGHPFTFWDAVLGVTIVSFCIVTLGLVLPVLLLALWHADKDTKHPVLRSDQIINDGSWRIELKT